MSERRYKVGLDRQQAMLLPASIDDYVSPANLARAIDAYVDSLDLKKQRMTNTEAGGDKGGQPAYPPGMLLKLYLYG
jgi:transposase